jgi:general stress protein 26
VDDADSEPLQALVQGFDRAMLVSRCGSGLRSRPTTVANTSDSRRLWLMSGIVGDPLEDLHQDPNVNVVMQDGVRFCSVSGTARIVRPTGDEAIWTDRQRAWLAQGPRRSSLVLIEVAPQYAEYWDRSGLRGLRFGAPQSEPATPGALERESAAAASHDSIAPTARCGQPSAAVADEPRGNVINLEKARWKRRAACTKE